MKEAFYFSFVVINLIGFMQGALNATEYVNGCSYSSIIERITPGYVAGCELFEKRFKK